MSDVPLHDLFVRTMIRGKGLADSAHRATVAQHVTSPGAADSSSSLRTVHAAMPRREKVHAHHAGRGARHRDVNKHIADGTITKTMDEVMSALKARGRHFYAHNGHRAMTLVVDAEDEASIVSMS